ncbi:hypothetical protein AB0B21_22500 [Streptomyces rimosus]|uniref:hypothetical protein n=1 Tax=Streptomyces rimosus TaxID=1927 RepID=UPI000518BF6B|nr:hypothetical protein [Streptomyces rimosus]
METFDDSTLEEIAAIICGDEPKMKRRAGWELAQFFRRAGWEDVPDHDGSPRHQWVQEMLCERQEDASGNVERVVLRLADRREYQQQLSEYDAVLLRLQEILQLECRRIEYRKGLPCLVTYDPDTPPPAQRVELKVAISDVVSDPDLARAVQLRLDEAHICQKNGAYTSAVIMLGSLLEGVLVHAAEVRTATAQLRRPAGDTRLQELIQFAHTNGWIDQDAKMASDLLRTYRNLVHPLAEKRAKHSADFDTADLCWSTVNAVLNDLAASNAPDGC